MMFTVMPVLQGITGSNCRKHFGNEMLNTLTHVSYFTYYCTYLVTKYPISQSIEVKGRILWLDIHKYESWYCIDSCLRMSGQVI